MAATSGVELNDPALQGTFTTFSNWIGEKGKFFCETVSNVSFYLSQVPGAPSLWEGMDKGFGNCKKVLSLPVAIKGTMSLYDKLLKEGVGKVRNLVGNVFQITGDAIDGIMGFQSFGIVTMSNKMAGQLKLIKGVTGVIGLPNAVYNMHKDLGRLRKINLNKVDHPEIKDVKKALELKKNLVNAEINNKWYERLRFITAWCTCVLGTAGLVASYPWAVAIISSIGLCGKYKAYSNQVASEFWLGRYAELMPVESQKGALFNHIDRI